MLSNLSMFWWKLFEYLFYMDFDSIFQHATKECLSGAEWVFVAIQWQNVLKIEYLEIKKKIVCALLSICLFQKVRLLSLLNLTVCITSGIKREWHDQMLIFKIFFFFMWLGFELRTSHLQSRLFTAWATPPVQMLIFRGPGPQTEFTTTEGLHPETVISAVLKDWALVIIISISYHRHWDV
jgi:hypothetical protein